MDGQVDVGIDVSKQSLDVAIGANAQPRRFDNDGAGHEGLVEFLEAYTVGRIVLEATGGLERPVVAALAAAGLPVVVVNPRQVRDFARATGQLAKTDAIDARILAQFGNAVRPEIRPIASSEQLAFKELVARRKQLVDMHGAESNRLQQAHDAVVKRSIRAVLKVIERQLDDTDRKLDQSIER